MNFSKSKRVKIFGVPVDLGVRPLGVEMGPTAIRCAGLTEALQYNDIEYVDYGDLKINRQINQNESIGEIARISEELAELVSETIEYGYIPIILGGDHSVSIGSITGVSKKAERLGLLWLDCHPDANTPETSPTGNVHGMTVAIALGYGYPQLVNCAEFSPKVLPENMCIIGAKDIDKGEKELLNRVGVRTFTLSDIERYGIVYIFEEAVKIVSNRTDRIHVSFDVDVLDPIIAPGTGIFSRGGLSYREISYITKILGKKNVITSCDFIGINPLADIRNQTSELIVELLITALGGSYGDYERYYLKKQL
jgi:arginase